MDRREFIGLGGGTAASVAMGGTGVGAQTAEIARVQSHLATAFRMIFREPGAPGELSDKLTVKVTSEFMEDYTFGTPWLGSPMGLEVPYSSKDGSAQIFSFTGPWSGVPQETVDRVFPDPDLEKHPDSNTMTGWSVQRTPLPPPSGGPGGRGVQPPRAMILQGQQDSLVIYRQTCIQTATLAADGTIGPIVTATNKPTSDPLIFGTLPPDTAYIPEMVTAIGNNGVTTGRRGLGLRDVKTFRIIPVDPQGFYEPIGNQVIKKIFPLKSLAAGQYLCVTLEAGGNVTVLSLLLDQTNPAQPVFRVATQTLVEHSANGCVYVTQNFAGALEIYRFDLPNVRHFGGWYDATGKAGIRHAQDKAMPDFHMPNYPSGSTWELQSMWNNVGSRIEIFLTIQEPGMGSDGNAKAGPLVSELWTTTMGYGGVWLAPMVIEKGVARIFPFTTASEVTVAVSKPRTGFEVWTRNGDGDWDSEHVRLENESGEMIEAAGYRVGLTLTRNNQPVTGVELGLGATVSTSAVVLGRHGTLGLHRKWQAACDSSGTLWVTVLLEDRLSFPQLLITCPLFSDRLVLDLNKKIEHFLGEVTPDKLMQARDPRRCTDEKADGCTADEVQSDLAANSGRGGVTDRGKAETAAGLIVKTLAAAPAEEQLNQASANIVLNSDCAAGWLPMNREISSLRRKLKPDLAPSWRLTRRNGEAHLEEVSFSEAEATIAEWRALHPVYEGGLFDFLSDAIDAIGDLAKAAYDGACQVLEATAAGLSIAVTLFVDGVKWVYNAVVDTIDMVMDALDFFLEYAGMALGMAIGWLLEQLGFLFDWAAIKRRRNDLKRLISTNLKPVLTKLGRPIDGAANLKKKIVGLKADIFSTLNSIRSTPADEHAYLSSSSEGGSFSNFSFMGGFDVLPQFTWFLDKLSPVLPKMRGGFAFPTIKNLDSLVEPFSKVILDLAVSMTSMFSDVATLFDEWVLQGKLITSAAFDPIIDLLLKLIGRIVDAFNSILVAGAGILQALWDQAGDILESLDTTLPLPAFFRGFYKGLVGNSPSAFDIVCLFAAIPEFAESKATVNNTAGISPLVPQLDRPRSAKPHLQPAAFSKSLHPRFRHGATALGSGAEDKINHGRDIATAFSGIAAVMAMSGAFFTATSTSGDPLDKISDVFTILNLVAKGCFYITELANDPNPWVIGGTGGLVTVILGILARTIYKDRNWFKTKKAALKDNLTPLLIAGAAVELIYADFEFIGESYDEGVSGLISALALLVTVAIREKRPMSPVPALTLGYVQGALNGACTALYYYRPISGT